MNELFKVGDKLICKREIELSSPIISSVASVGMICRISKIQRESKTNLYYIDIFGGDVIFFEKQLYSYFDVTSIMRKRKLEIIRKINHV